MNTRGGGKVVKSVTRTSSRHAPDEPATSPTVAPSPALPSSEKSMWSKLLVDPGSETVQLKATGLPTPLPLIGDVELVFREWCRHRVWRIEVRDTKAIIDVHPDDASSCIAGVTHIAGKQIQVNVIEPGSAGSEGGNSKKRQRSPAPSSDSPGAKEAKVDSAAATATVAKEATKTAAQREKEKKAEEERQRRQYRVGLSYRCGRCGMPKKGHVCSNPDGDADTYDKDGNLKNPEGKQPVLAAVVRSSSAMSNGVPRPGSVGKVEVSGEATTIFKDMSEALGDNQSSTSPMGAAPAGTPGTGASAGSAGSAPNSGGPQLSDMDMMLADLAFAARPPPVITPHEGDGVPLSEVRSAPQPRT